MEHFIDLDRTAVMVAGFVQAAMVLFWIVSPLMGYVIANQVKKHGRPVLATAGALLAFNLIFVGLRELLLPYLTNANPLTDDQRTVIAAGVAAAIALILHAYLLWLTAKSPSHVDEEIRNIRRGTSQTNQDFSFQAKRRDRLKKRHRS
jgi:ABC-type Fe3+ transport system permease subunit